VLVLLVQQSWQQLTIHVKVQSELNSASGDATQQQRH